MPYCPNCGAEVGPEDRFCGSCGEATVADVHPRPNRSRRSVLALTVICGVLILAAIAGLGAYFLAQRAAPQGSDGSWPMFQGNAQRTGRSATVATGSKVRWTMQGGAYGIAVAPDGTVYGSIVLNDKGHLFAIGPNGKQKWATKGLDNGSLAGPALGQDGTVYAPQGADLDSFRPNGQKVWTFRTEAAVWSSPAIGADGTIYFSNDAGVLYAVRQDGRKKWRLAGEPMSGADVQNGGHVGTSPALALSGTVYFVDGGATLHAVRPDGREAWTFHRGGQGIATSPVLGSDGTIYVGSANAPPDGYGGAVWALGPDGSVKWSRDWNFGRYPPALAADGTLYVGEFENPNPTSAVRLRAILPNGGEKWTHSFGAASMPLVAPVVDSAGVVYAATGKVVYAFRPDGSLKWQQNLPGSAFSLAIGPTGVLYVGTDSAVVALGK